MSKQKQTDAIQTEQTLLPAVQQRALVVAPPQGTSLALCPCSFARDTVAGKAKLLRAASPSPLRVTADQPLRMVVTDWLVMPDSQVDETTGEVSEFIRVVFFDAAGRHFRTTAAHGVRRLQAMLDLFTLNEWAQGIPLVISEQKSKRGTTYHDIQVDI